MTLKVGFARCWLCAGEAYCHGTGEAKADEGFGGDLNLLAASDCLRSRAHAAASSGSDACPFATAKYAAQNGTDGGATADFLGGILAAAVAFLAVCIGGDLQGVRAGLDVRELDDEERTAFEVGGLVDGVDATGYGGSLAKDDAAIDEDVGGEGSGEGVAFLSSGAIESLA